MSQLTYADRPVRDWGGGWDLVIEQRPLGPNGALWGPALLEVTVSGSGHTRALTLGLTSGEARTLAGPLLAGANMIDLA